MAGKSNYLENLILNRQFRTDPGTVRPASQTLHLYYQMPGEDGTGGLELDGTNYAAKAITMTDAAWKDPATPLQGTIHNLAEFDFGAVAEAGDPVRRLIGWGIQDNLGNLRHFAVFKEVGANWQEFVASAGSDVFTVPGHGIANDSRVLVRGPNIPTPLAEATEYWVISATADTFQLATSQGGAAIDITANGGGQVVKSGAQDVNVGNIIKIPANSLVLVEN